MKIIKLLMIEIKLLMIVIKMLMIVIKKVIDDSDNVFLRFNKYKTKNKITFCPCIL